MARAGDAAESSLFRVDVEERPGLVSRIFMVLRDQRAVAAVSESALPARLQHGATAVVLAVSFAVAVSMERVSAGDQGFIVQAVGPSGTDEVTGVVSDGIHSGVLHFFNHAGVLLDAVLSGACAVAGFGDGRGKRVDQAGNAAPWYDRGACGAGHLGNCVRGAKFADAG